MTELTPEFIQAAIDDAFEKVHRTERVSVCEACWDYLNTLYKQWETSPFAQSATVNPASEDASSYLNLSIKLLLAMKQLTEIAGLLSEHGAVNASSHKSPYYLYH